MILCSFKYRKLEINTRKTKLMRVSVECHVKNQLLEQVVSFKYMRVMLNKTGEQYIQLYTYTIFGCQSLVLTNRLEKNSNQQILIF